MLAESGYAHSSVVRIAQRIGASKSVITYHFASKDELMRRVALSLFEECTAHVAACTAAATTPADRLRARITGELEFFSSRRVAFLAMTEVMANHRDTAFVGAFAEASTAEVDAIAELLVQGQAMGQFRLIDAGEAAHAISAATCGVLDRWADDEAFDLVSASAKSWDFVESAESARYG